MASPTPISRASTFRRGSFALQEDPFNLSYKGQGALSTLIRRRSTFVAFQQAPDEEEGDGDPYGQDGSGSADEARRRQSSATPRRSSSTNSSSRLGDDLQRRRQSGSATAGAGQTMPMAAAQVRSMRLIGHSNPRYRWARYWKSDAELAQIRRREVRAYYERNNWLLQQYLYIDRLLDSSLPHDLLNEYEDVVGLPAGRGGVEVPTTIHEEPPSPVVGADAGGATVGLARKVERTPRAIYHPTELTPLFAGDGHIAADDEGASPTTPDVPELEDGGGIEASSHLVTLAIYVNLLANAALLAGKIVVVLAVPSVSVLASLVDAALDFLSTGIVWITTWLISRQDQYRYPIGRRRLEPLGVLVFSVVMITSFVQVALEALQRLFSPDHEIIELGIPAMAIMLGTIVIKGMVWVWLRSVKNSSIAALAADAATDVVFNTGSIAFPIVGFYAKIWWLDSLGGLLLSLYVISNWSQSAGEHIKHLCGFSATSDQRNILLYLTMRFANTIEKIQGLQAYHAGDKLNVEVDIVLDANTSLKDSHDLSESLQYVLESVPIVDRAFVHVDYASYNLPTHLQQQC